MRRRAAPRRARPRRRSFLAPATLGHVAIRIAVPAAFGSETMNVDPSPGTLSSEIFPPIMSTIWLLADALEVERLIFFRSERVAPSPPSVKDCRA
jgi:hypothetical protein